MNEKSIRVLLVDDHTILRDGMASILHHIEDIEVVGGISSGEEVVNTFAEYNPHVILMDIMMSGMNGLEATRWIKEQNDRIKIIIVSSEISKDFVSKGIKCGIDGYLPKDVDKETLIEAIRTVNRGEKYFNQAITSLVFEDFYNIENGERKNKRSISPDLTKRENEVLEQIASGKSNREAADALSISIKTIETHKTNILEKLGLKNTAELVRYAVKHNIISID
jgi:DNA-binding NarL/FixJ family response regulator